MQEYAIQRIAKVIKAARGRALVVGGSVRDKYLLKKPIPSDYDIEVYHLAADDLEKVLITLGTIKTIGKAFGVYQLTTKEGYSFDISLPRTDSKTGKGHKGFIVIGNPELSVKEASRRRDFTINAILEDPLTGQVFDYFGGRRDLRQKLLRVVDATTFGDDPLRAWRAMQLVGRFDLKPDRHTLKIIEKTAAHTKELPAARIQAEFRKLFVLADRPSIGLNFALQADLFAHFSARIILPLATTAQDKKWHPEGSVWDHTLLAVDTAVAVAKREGLSDAERLFVTMGAFMHDLGKPATTAKQNARIHSHGHSLVGVGPAMRLMRALELPKLHIKKYRQIIRFHMHGWLLQDGYVDKRLTEIGKLRKLAFNLQPATLQELTWISETDLSGRVSYSVAMRKVRKGMPRSIQWLRALAQKEGFFTRAPKPLFNGKTLQSMGYKGKEINRVQKNAERALALGKSLTEIKKQLVK